MQLVDAVGYRRIHVLLRREGHQANHKRVFRLYQDAKLAVPKRKRRRGIAVEQHPLRLPEAPNQVWSMDFVMDALSNGRRLKCLNIVDDCTKEAVDIVVDHSITGDHVVRVLERAAPSGDAIITLSLPSKSHQTSGDK